MTTRACGLVEALARLIPIEVIQSEVLLPLAALGGISFGQPSAWKGLPSPDLLLGAGHRTHLSLLAARRSRGGKAVVLMQPTLPLYLFDLCLIPEHDGIAPRKNVVLTRGALNRIRPSDRQESGQGLLLVGGPSAHFGWDAKALHDTCRGDCRCRCCCSLDAWRHRAVPRPIFSRIGQLLPMRDSRWCPSRLQALTGCLRNWHVRNRPGLPRTVYPWFMKR